jgi:multisubunit Na+/H+ antiporter MnhF subunit
VIGLWIGVVLLGVTVVMAGFRMLVGPDDANRAVAADLLFFAVIGLIALAGAIRQSGLVFDVIVVASAVGFLAAVSLARTITRGRR